MCAQFCGLITPTAPWSHHHNQHTEQVQSPHTVPLWFNSPSSPQAVMTAGLSKAVIQMESQITYNLFNFRFQLLLPLCITSEFIQVTDCVRSLLFLIAAQYSIVWMFDRCFSPFPSLKDDQVVSTYWQLQTELCTGAEVFAFL